MPKLLPRPFLVALALGSLGCLAPKLSRTHRDAPAVGAKLRTVAVLPTIRVFEVSAGDVKELQPEWTAQSSQHVLGALTKGLEARGLKPKPLTPGKGDAELEEVQRLYEEVGQAIFTFAYPPYPSDFKVEHFEYSVGPIGKLLDRAGADALLVAYARDDISTTGRRLTSLFSGLQGAAMLNVGLVDREGRVVWFDLYGGLGYDLREQKDVDAIVGRLMQDFAEVRK